MNWEPPGFAHGRAAGCDGEREARLRGFHRPRLRDHTRAPARVGGGAHQEGGKIASPFLSFRPTVSFPAVASRPNAQTTRTTPSVGRRWRPTSVHLDFHLLPSGFPAKTHTPLLSSLLSISKHATERLDRERESEIAFWEIDGIIGSQQIRRGEERKKEGRAEEKKKTLEIQ